MYFTPPLSLHGVHTDVAFNMLWLSARPCSKISHVCQHSGTVTGVQLYQATSGLGPVGFVYMISDSENLKKFTALKWKCKGRAMHIPPSQNPLGFQSSVRKL